MNDRVRNIISWTCIALSVAIWLTYIPGFKLDFGRRPLAGGGEYQWVFHHARFVYTEFSPAGTPGSTMTTSWGYTVTGARFSTEYPLDTLGLILMVIGYLTRPLYRGRKRHGFPIETETQKSAE